MKEAYHFQKIEKKWQQLWHEKNVFQVDEDSDKTKFYCLEMYPYPSGKIHMGHVRNYTIVDVISRFQMMRGFNVLHPIGWDAFGMPAENAAIKHGIHPGKWTLDNVEHMKNQLKRMGFSYDWSREVNTCLPEYYRWNQWIFLKLLERKMAFRKNSRVNWCPDCQTVLANEQVVSEKCWRCDTTVEFKTMEQWFLKITDYAEELLTGHELLGKWPEYVLAMQKNWIGKSTGAHVKFPLENGAGAIEVFTTRIDTIFGATFMVLSPEHPLSMELVSNSPDKERLQGWIKEKSSGKQMRDPLDFDKEGIDTGMKAVNPFTGENIPVWIADYVLMEYGTGAIMAVPAHDARDNEFARRYGLEIREVIKPRKAAAEENDALFEDYGILVNSGSFNGMDSKSAMTKMALFAEEKGFGKASTLFRLRDWGISRQRYWGTPIPVLYCDHCGVVGVPYEDLPVTLPMDVEFGEEDGSPLERSEAFRSATCPTCGGKARRESDTMDTFFDSSWYYFRYCSPQDLERPFDSGPVKYWMPVDIYVGGVEHACMHLIYARFFCKFLRDFGLTEVDEPFPHYLAQGMVTKDGSAMSKSKGNVVDPDEMISDYGADTLRLFILFAAPPEKEFAWNEKGIEGSFRFLNRIWGFFQDNSDLLQISEIFRTDGRIPDPLLIKMHQTIKKVTGDIECRFHFNTAISAIMEFFNQMKKDQDRLRETDAGRALLGESMRILLLLLAPFASHLSEELWLKTGRGTLIAREAWPEFDPALAREETVTIVVQVNGRVRDKFEMERDLPEDRAKQLALESERIRTLLGDREPKKVIYIANKLINIVIKS